jgi:beta-galactosidase
LKKVYGGEKIPDRKYSAATTSRKKIKSFHVKENLKTLEVFCEDYSFSIDRESGSLNCDMFNEPLSVNIFRAPTDNDRNVIQKWIAAGFNDAKPEARKITVNEKARSVDIAGKMLSAHRAPCLTYSLSYMFFNCGISVSFKYETGTTRPPRAGLVFAIENDIATISYIGRGPYECYADTKPLCGTGKYTLPVEEFFTDYIKPQENGSRSDVSEFILNGKENRIRITADREFSFNALPYSAKTLFAARHNWELPKTDRLFISLDAAMRGIGSNSCGPQLLEEFEIPHSGGTEFTIEFTDKCCYKGEL